MLMDVRTAFDSMVSELDWMDVKTRAKAHRKLQAMRPFVGFPEWITHPDKLDKFYSKVSEEKKNSDLIYFFFFSFVLFSRDADVKKSWSIM